MIKLSSIAFMASFIALITLNANAQNQSMTIQHSGLAPNDTLWVAPGELIDFIYGGGGNHPMTSGQGGNPSPVFFPTVTVTTSNPLVTFSLTTIGTYIFHCGTNPGNTNNWGTIIVQSNTGIEESNQSVDPVIIYPNPSQNELIIQSSLNEPALFTIIDMSGKTISTGKFNFNNSSVDISTLGAGTYIIKLELAVGIVTKQFVKN